MPTLLPGNVDPKLRVVAATGAWAGRPVHQARVFPGPPGSRPARSLICTHSGDTCKATIGREGTGPHPW